MYLVDTNVISGARKGAKAHAGVIAFFQRSRTSDVYLSAQTRVFFCSIRLDKTVLKIRMLLD